MSYCIYLEDLFAENDTQKITNKSFEKRFDARKIVVGLDPKFNADGTIKAQASMIELAEQPNLESFSG